MVATATASSALPTGNAARSGFYDGNVTLVGGYAGATTATTAERPSGAEEHANCDITAATERGPLTAQHTTALPPLGGMRLAR
jgi:hypothetical protein